MRPEVYGDTTPYYSTSIMLMHPIWWSQRGVYTPIYPPRRVYTGCITSLRYTPPAVSPRPRSTSPLLMSCSHGCRALYLYTRYNASTTCSHAFTCGLHHAHLYGCVYTLLGALMRGIYHHIQVDMTLQKPPAQLHIQVCTCVCTM